MIPNLATPNPSHNALISLLEEIQPQIKVLFERYEISEKDAEILVQETLEALFYKWESISNPRYWMLKALEHRCKRHAAENTSAT